MRPPEQAPAVLDRALVALHEETGSAAPVARALRRPSKATRREALYELALSWPDVPLVAGFVLHLALCDPGLAPWTSWAAMEELVVLETEHTRYRGQEGLSELERWERDQLAKEADRVLDRLCAGMQPPRMGTGPHWNTAE